MAEVLQPPGAAEGTSFYQTSGLKRSARSSSAPYCDSPVVSTSPRLAPPFQPPTEHVERVLTSPPSSAVRDSPLSSPTDVDMLDTLASTPVSSDSSLEKKYKGKEDPVTGPAFPEYATMRFYDQTEPFDESQSSDEPVESTTTETTRSDSPVPTPQPADDTAIKAEPKQHVDYLSHNWREEDIWSSWRHIVSQRRVYGQRSRLENASWRTWAKSKYQLRTVSPETLNWLKESDVTWLYGPLKPAESHPITANRSEPISQLSKTNSFVSKKPILKKRSMSEIMLQRSLSSSSLVKQAAASVQAQQGRRSRRTDLQRANSDFIPSGVSSEAPSRDQVDYFTSRSNSDNATPCECAARRHIRFDDKVEQCIAVECKDDGVDDDSESESENEHRFENSSDSSSDDGIIMMKRTKRPRRKNARKEAGGKYSSQNRKIIETLPATTLKYRTDSPDIADQAQKHHTFGRNWSPQTLSPSPSQETLRPSHPSRNFLLVDVRKDDQPETSSWSFGASNPKSSLGAASPTEEIHPRWSRRENNFSSRVRSQTPGPPPGDPTDDEFNTQGMKRTSSGMFMPYDEDEEEMMAVGLFGRVSEAINTAKDIGHVLWNVGWRK
ncbi:hypothetical protein M433DRAFT_7125 [Acidomyces richmondensis BFW]|nr:MAG: hypothetical protein FE78DRAFT_26866 [Acidomyces sp. 'richmondensis']KYG42471.1 hypothetical protein M433DRAFT_7125 [Acidomyces richmondensis BFW]